MNKKKTVVINTDYLLLKTGLGRNGRILAEYLHRTGKYNIVYYACGVPWDNPEYSRFPFKVVGTLPNSQQELEALSRDPAQARGVSYGMYYVDRLIKEFKPDVFITSNDSWASHPMTDRIWWNKIHCIPHITLDSLPFLPDQVKYIQNSKQFLVWADFATKEANRLGFNNVKTLSGIIDKKHFFKIPKFERNKLRNKYAIPDDALVCGFVFRNQLRKELKPLLEGFQIFKQQNPDKKAYLLLHTHFGEPAGWDIPRFCDELGIDKNLILTTYVCKNCHNYEIKPFTGQDLNCPSCHAEKTQTTCNVLNGVSEQQLNEVYNIMDCYCHLLNAGGLEMPLVESLYCELPLATIGYSSGEMFTDQPFVYPVKFTYTVQHGTQFKRSVPQPFSVAKFLEKIYSLSEAERNEIGVKGRAWAISRFSIEVVGKQWEELLDALPDHNWDFNFEPKPKNPQAVIPQINDDSEWLIVLYKEILNMTVDSNDDGHKHWMLRLRNGEKREVIENFFRNTAQQENQKNQSVDFGTILDNTGKKRLLFLMKESIGDIINATALLKSVQDQYPDHDIYFATDPQYFDLVAGIPQIHKIIPYHPFMENELNCTGAGHNKGYFDVYMHPAIATQRHLNYLTNNNIALDLNS